MTNVILLPEIYLHPDESDSTYLGSHEVFHIGVIMGGRECVG